jgi:glycosyltransferase involved in cell wall biosynthesis
MTLRPEVVFVGGFNDRMVKGGQVFACKSLIASPISEEVRWVLVDSSMASLPPPPFWRRAWYAMRRVLQLARALSTVPSAVLIFTSAGASFVEKSLMVLLARLCGSPVVLCPRSGLIIDMVDRSRLARWMVKLAASASLVVCQGQGWADYYSRLAPSIRTKVIPNFIDTEAYSSIPPPVDDSETRILFLGWIDRNKGIYELLAAAERLLARGRKFKLILAGSGAEMESFRQAVSASPASRCIETPGWVDGAGKRRLLAWSHLLVLPSYREGLPNVVLEAMASGRAVVATSVGAVPEVVQPCVTGLLCPPGDSESLADALDQLVTHPEQVRTMGVAARARAIRSHSVAAQWPAWRAAIFSQFHEN